MIIIYYCYGSAHSSVTAANIHLGHLPLERRAPVREIIHQPLFDRSEHGRLGAPTYMGEDAHSNRIYVIGLAGAKAEMVQALTDFLDTTRPARGQIRFENALQHAGVLLRIGGYISRRLGLVWLGRPLSGLGVWLKYGRFADHVRRVMAETGSETAALTCQNPSDIMG